MNDREICYRILYDILIGEGLSHEVLKKALDDCDRNKADVNKAFITKVVNGVTERWLTLTFIISRQAGRPIGKIKPALRIIMAMALYQGAFMNVPVSAACNEAVKLVKKHNMNGLSGFANGVLRGFFRKLEGKSFDEVLDEELKDAKLKGEALLEVKYSCPEWLIKHYLTYMNREALENMLSYGFKESNITVYRMVSKASEEELESAFLEDKVEYNKLSSIAYELNTKGSVMALKAFKKGMCLIQDYSSIMASEVAPLIEYPRILDLCAAPGGKCIHTADRFLSHGGHVLALDVSESKVNKIEDNIKRVGLTNIETGVNDARVFNKRFENTYDIVIADVPCSGLGVITKKPDIKYKTKANDIESLAILQREILDNAVKYVKEGGYIVYSTCTIAKAENEEQAKYIKSLGFELIEDKQLLITEKNDGFYYALLKRVNA